MPDDEKKPRGAKALYDNPRSGGDKGRDREAAATAEADVEAGDEPKADKKADGEVKTVEKASDKFLKAIGEVRKRHESERRDFHGTHREQLRQMAARHDKELGALIETHSPAEGNANDVDGGESMPGGAAVVDGAEA